MPAVGANTITNYYSKSMWCSPEIKPHGLISGEHYMKTQKGEHAYLERRHADRLQASSDVSFQLQQQFQQRGACA